MQEMTKDYVARTLSEETMWKAGEEDTFSFMTSQKWEFTLRRETDDYKPFTYSLRGRKTGTHETWSRKYASMEDAFLHIVNRLDENTNIKDRYKNIDEWLSEKEDT